LVNRLTELLAEARRRRVFRTAGVYLVAVWGLSQGAVELAPLFGAPEWLLRAVLVGAVAFLPVVVLLAWMFDVGLGGVVRDPRDVGEARPEEDEDLANIPTVLGSDSSQGAVLVRWVDANGENAALFTDEFFLGRGSDCRVRFYDPLVSRRHARVHHEQGVWRIADLGSRNGTIVGSEKVIDVPLAPESDVRVNEAGPTLRLEVLEPGAETRNALTRHAEGPTVAHVRSASLDLDRTRGSESIPK
jgi:hypothetical protein